MKKSIVFDEVELFYTEEKAKGWYMANGKAALKNIELMKIDVSDRSCDKWTFSNDNAVATIRAPRGGWVQWIFTLDFSMKSRGNMIQWAAKYGNSLTLVKFFEVWDRVRAGEIENEVHFLSEVYK